MRVVIVLVALLVSAQAAVSQAPPAQPEARPASVAPVGDLNQVMRGVLFPNSNIIFNTQTSDPADPKNPFDVTVGNYAHVYTGWPVVELAAVALAESADLLLKPGRLCENGRPVPVAEADYKKFSEDLVTVGKAALKAAQSRNHEAMVKVAGDVSDACMNCHAVYRNRRDVKNRCVRTS
jgi:hypothetical protein